MLHIDLLRNVCKGEGIREGLGRGRREEGEGGERGRRGGEVERVPLGIST